MAFEKGPLDFYSKENVESKLDEEAKLTCNNMWSVIMLNEASVERKLIEVRVLIE